METQIVTRQERLQEYEDRIEQGMRAFYEVGQSLMSINQDRLYLEAGYKTFDDYCQQRWDIKRGRAYQLIEATKIYGNLTAGDSAMSTTVDILPKSERQTRPLSNLEPADQVSAWKKSVDQAGGQPTAKQVAQVVREIKPITKKSQTHRTIKPAVSTSGFNQVNHYDDFNQAAEDDGVKRVKGFTLEELQIMIGEFDDGTTCPYCRHGKVCPYCGK